MYWDTAPVPLQHCRMSKVCSSGSTCCWTRENPHSKSGPAVLRACPLGTGHAWQKTVLACLPIPLKRRDIYSLFWPSIQEIIVNKYFKAGEVTSDSTDGLFSYLHTKHTGDFQVSTVFLLILSGTYHSISNKDLCSPHLKSGGQS